MVRYASLMTLACIMICQSSCQTLDKDKAEDEEILRKIVLQQKEDSLRHLPTSIKGIPARRYAVRHITPLTSGAKEMRINEKKGGREDNSIEFRVGVFGIKGVDLGFSTAVAITADGYYLTAAHCLDSSPVHLILPDEGYKKAVLVKPRIVWKADRENGNKNENEPDLALIHLPGKLQPIPLEKLEAEDLQKGTLVISSGYGGLNINQAAGHITKVSEIKHGKSGARWWEIHHSAPTFYGDSGGLLMDAKGNFIGVNYGSARSEYRILGRPWVRHYFSAAILPDPEWIDELIDEDRRWQRK